MPKLRYIIILAILFTASSGMVNMGQMFWTHGSFSSTDQYDNNVISASSDEEASRVVYRSGAPLTISYFSQAEQGDVPRSIFDSLLDVRWSILHIIINTIFWFIFLWGSVAAIARTKNKGSLLKTSLLAMLLQLALIFYSIQITSDYLKIAAPFNIWLDGEFLPVGLIFSYLLLLALSALLLFIWGKFREQRQFRPSQTTYRLLGVSALFSLLAYLIASFIIPGQGGSVLGFDLWIDNNLTAEPETFYADLAYAIYSLSHYALFFIPAAATVALWQSGNRRLALIPLPAINIIYFTVPLIKLLYLHPRPPDPLVILGETAFPGGLATLTVVFPVLALMLFRDKKRWEYLLAGFAFSVFICCAWVAVGVHWAGDFIGGYVLGILIFSVWSAIVFLLPIPKLDKIPENTPEKDISAAHPKA